MLGDEGDTPSRSDLLSMVKKHSKNLSAKPLVDEQDDSTDEVHMDSGFWRDVFDFYFVRGKESKGCQDDDLLFFVRKNSLPGIGFGDYMEGGSPYFVRRWAPKLDTLINDNSAEVDWRCSFFLNLIAHTSFTVTVAICSHLVLRNHQSGQGTTLTPVYKVVKTVYASPSRVNFRLDSQKEVETIPAYPDICFAVDDFDSTSDAVVLTSTDHCYCVFLNAHDGAAFPLDNGPNHCSSSSTSKSPQKNHTNSDKAENSKITLFSGFVSYPMVREAYVAGKSRFGSLLSPPGKVDRLYMKGPGGRGEVEVAVSGVADESQENSVPFSPVSSNNGFGIGSIVHKAASVASVAAKNAYAAASAATTTDEMVPLKCCLMSISLPWEYIAYDLLFKGTPPVNL